MPVDVALSKSQSLNIPDYPWSTRPWHSLSDYTLDHVNLPLSIQFMKADLCKCWCMQLRQQIRCGEARRHLQMLWQDYHSMQDHHGFIPYRPGTEETCDGIGLQLFHAQGSRLRSLTAPPS